ncbi:MAG: hypothetical protein ACP5VE_05790 [Chthonomonadales bacterium]
MSQGGNVAGSCGPAGGAAQCAADALRMGLASLWLVLPAIQYAGTLVRAGLLGQPSLSRLADLDLTPWYSALLAATLLFALLDRRGR